MSIIHRIRPLGFQWDTLDPFLFCVYHLDHFPKGNDQMGPDASLEGRSMGADFQPKDGWRMYHGQQVPGFPGHPHRGFETITVVRQGMVDHTDSMGAAGRYGDGDVQWMTAGRGLQHSEMFPLLNRENNNTLELFQIWLNLPKKSKFVDPHFKMMWAEQLPVLPHQDSKGNKTTVEIIAGGLNGLQPQQPPPHSWASDPRNEVAVWNLHMDAHAEWTLPPTTFSVNRSLYIYSGSLKVENQVISSMNAIDVQSEVDVQLKAGETGASILLLQGKPIDEPVVQHGPFVMNSKEEIQEAFQEYQQTQFGGWPWPAYEYTHPRTQGRFAKYADGQQEQPGT